jgi:predicted MPP superfamily phosphohydrolase
MIARAPYLFILLIIIPDLYFDFHYWRRKYSLGQRFCRWLPTIGLVVYTIYLMYEKNFIPDNPNILYIYLLLLGLIAIPKLVYMLCSITGLTFSKLIHRKSSKHPAKNYGNLIGLVCVPVIWYIVLYGSFIGFNKVEVNRQTFTSPDLPKAFDGYKVVLFSDAHVGSYTARNEHVLKKAIELINAQHPDMIVYTGDIQNTQPQDIYRHMDVLSSLRAKDGIYSILGNHDYGDYICGNTAKKVANMRETMSLEKQMGWTLLMNEHRYIDRGKSHIIIAGMENDGDGIRFPQKGNIKKALKGINDDDFILMLEHDPSSWRRRIIPDGRAQLTLSGHTHKMQFALFDWCPMSLTGKEVNGWYTEDEQTLFVTAGLGGLIPFRFGAPGEIAVITLKTQSTKD